MVVFDSKVVTARKEHRCDYCGGKIKKGTRYVKWDGIDDYFYHCCAHEECVELVEKRKYDNGIEEFTTDDVAISIVDDCKNLGIETKDKGKVFSCFARGGGQLWYYKLLA